jgi:hypothetical protein
MASAHVAFANEPANHVVLAEHDFSFVPSDPAAGSPLEGFWNLYPGYPQMGLQEANHADARTSAPDTVEVELAGGLEPYSQGWWIEAWEPTYGAYSQAYMSMSVKLLGDDFENDQGGILLGFFSVAIQEDTELRLQVLVAPSQSPRDAAFPAKVALNEYPANMTLRTFLPNVDDRDLLTVGEFHEIELLLTNNTIGEADGTLKLWIDGVHVADYDDLQMQTAAIPGNIGYFVELIDWLGSTARDEDDVIAVDHIRISALP